MPAAWSPTCRRLSNSLLARGLVATAREREGAHHHLRSAIARIDLEHPLVVGKRLGIALPIGVERAPVHEGRLVAWVQLDGLIVIRKRLLGLTQAAVRYGAIVVDAFIAWSDLSRSAVVGKRPIVLADTRQGDGTPDPRLEMSRIGDDERAQILNGPVRTIEP